VEDKAKAKAKAQAKRLVAEKARKARGKVVEEKPLEADKGLEKAQVLVKDKALAKVQAKARVLVLEKEVKVNLADRAKALEAVKVQAKAREKVAVAVMDRAKAKVQAKAVILVKVVTLDRVVKALVPENVRNVMVARNRFLKIILRTLWKTL